MALTGGLVYVHAVSAPAWSVAIALALWFMPGNEKKWKEKIKWAALALLVFIVVLIPFAQDYFGNTQFGEVDAQDLTVVQNIIRYRHADGMIDIATAIDGFFRIAIASSWVMLHVKAKGATSTTPFSTSLFALSVVIMS